MSEIDEVIARVTDAKVYQEWRKENKRTYVCSLFRILGDGEHPGWQVDFYDRKKDTITSFMAGSPVTMVGKDSKIFKEANAKVEKLDAAKVKMTVADALNMVNMIKNEKYPTEVATKTIVILQRVGRTLWNISYVTKALNILNVKIDAESGDIMEESVRSILSLREA